jgi:starvation-inducible outer membrane lipoprotein
MKCRRQWAILVAFPILLSGCGTAAPPGPKADEAAFKNTTPDDKAVAAEFLKKANIEGEIVALIKGDTHFQVDVMKKMEPGKRMMPSPPTSYSIDRKTGAVKKEL